MQLHYHVTTNGNFGDDLNAWIWDELLPGWEKWDAESTLVGIGTLLNDERLSQFSKQKLLIIGSGVGYGSIPKLPLPKNWDIRCVRGPRSASLLGIDSGKAVIDPAALLPDLKEFQDIQNTQETIFVPHAATSSRFDWKAIQERCSVKIVLPDQDAKTVVTAIGSAKLVVAESMHAAIIADTFRVPWIGVKISDLFLRDKWLDWAESLQVSPNIEDLLPNIRKIRWPTRSFQDSPRFLRKLRHRLESYYLPKAIDEAAHRRPQLSDEAVLKNKKDILRSILEKTAHDYA